MSRLHGHISVDYVDHRIQCYSDMFGVAPMAVKPGYAESILDDPPVDFAIAHRRVEAGLNHLGIQVESAGELGEMQPLLTLLQPDEEKEEEVASRYAKSDKYWVTDSSGIAWEIFHTLDSIPVSGEPHKTEPAEAACCISVVKPRIRLTTEGPCRLPSPSAKQGSTCC